jgi:diguanylate cyclase (GGDEF)-like protein/PAS domain S-box-containing protein
VKLLVIDDDRSVRQLLRTALVAAGYDVLTAADGEEGLALTRIARPALVLTDILMPRMDGFQYLNVIRSDRDFDALPVVFYTGNYLDQEDELLARRLGVSRFLIKPMSPAEVVAVIRDVLEHPAASLPTDPPVTLRDPAMQALYSERLVSKLKHKIVENEEARRTLENIMEGLADGVMVIDHEYTIIQVNSVMAASLALEKSAVIGRKCYEVTHHQSEPCEDADILCPHRAIFGRDWPSVRTIHTHVNANGEEGQTEISATPLKDDAGRVIAIVQTCRDVVDKSREDELVKLVKQLSAAQAHLTLMATTDELTGLKNRRHIRERLAEEIQRSKRTGDHLGLIMLDIDHFKQINDSHGHLFGDVVLKVVASRIRTSLRMNDYVGRVGGEEFLIICLDSSLADALHVAEKIRRGICELPMGDGIKEVMVAVSAGVTTIQENDHDYVDAVRRADAALYRAKEAGRNRVVAA